MESLWEELFRLHYDGHYSVFNNHEQSADELQSTVEEVNLLKRDGTDSNATSVDEENRNRTLRMGDLEYWMDTYYIKGCFSFAAEDVSVKIEVNKQTGTIESLIEFPTHAMAEKVLRYYNGTLMPPTDQPFNLTWAPALSSPGESRKDDGAKSPEITDCHKPSANRPTCTSEATLQKTKGGQQQYPPISTTSNEQSQELNSNLPNNSSYGYGNNHYSYEQGYQAYGGDAEIPQHTYMTEQGYPGYNLDVLGDFFPDVYSYGAAYPGYSYYQQNPYQGKDRQYTNPTGYLKPYTYYPDGDIYAPPEYEVPPPCLCAHSYGACYSEKMDDLHSLLQTQVAEQSNAPDLSHNSFKSESSVMGREGEDADEPRPETEYNIELVMKRTRASYSEAVKALEAACGNVDSAVVKLTIECILQSEVPDLVYEALKETLKPESSAAAQDDEDVDEDGFEIVDFKEVEDYTGV